MTADFYRQFEDQFRAPRAVIKERLGFYQPLLQLLERHPSPKRALDLGCGRGEWLEVLLENGFDARGVDLDQGMLAACQALNLPATQGDALQALQQAPDNSLALVSAFHVVEHIPFEMLLTLGSQAHRALAPGGLLIMETPNPENISVGTSSFYLDPTHSKPIPHALLAFVTQYQGFGAHKVMRANESHSLARMLSEEPSQEPTALKSIELADLLFGASPDYAVVAIKGGDDELMERFQALVAQNYGVAIETIAQRYDAQLANRFDDLRQDLQQVMKRTEEALVLRRQTIEELDILRREYRAMSKHLERIYASGSWRTTRPFRAIAKLSGALREHGVTGMLTPVAHYLDVRPQRKAQVFAWLNRLGLRGIKDKLVIEHAPIADLANTDLPEDLQTLPPDAREIDALAASEMPHKIPQQAANKSGD